MTIIVSPNGYTVNSKPSIIGYVGETDTRMITIDYPNVPTADIYRIRFEYLDGVIYDVPINDGIILLRSSVLRLAGKVRCQWMASKSVGESYTLVAKSNIFILKIGESIGGDISPVPTYEMVIDILDEIKLQLGICTEQANLAITNATNAKTYANNANASALASENSAKNATSSETTALEQSKIAIKNAEISTEQAKIAIDKVTPLANSIEQIATNSNDISDIKTYVGFDENGQVLLGK